MKKPTDPLALMKALASATPAASAETGAVASMAEVPAPLSYEIPLVPKSGAQLERLTVAGTYRTPIPILYDPQTRTAYPLPSDG